MAVETSILTTVKVGLDVSQDDPSFDGQLITLINGALSNLVDFGIGPAEGFEIEGVDETWDELLGSYADLNRVKTWLVFKVREGFDPPQTQALMDSLQKLIAQAEWRIINKEDGDRWLERQVVV